MSHLLDAVLQLHHLLRVTVYNCSPHLHHLPPSTPAIFPVMLPPLILALLRLLSTTPSPTDPSSTTLPTDVLAIQHQQPFKHAFDTFLPNHPPPLPATPTPMPTPLPTGPSQRL